VSSVIFVAIAYFGEVIDDDPDGLHLTSLEDQAGAANLVARGQPGSGHDQAGVEVDPVEQYACVGNRQQRSRVDHDQVRVGAERLEYLGQPLRAHQIGHVQGGWSTGEQPEEVLQVSNRGP